MDQQILEEFQRTHVAGWNEPDSEKRLALLKKIYAEDIKMYDKEFILNGIEDVSYFIGKLIAGDPVYSFTAAKSIELLQDGARLYGHITTGGGALNSMDFFIFENDYAVKLYAFMEPA